MTQYRAVVGIDYPPNKRAEAGDIVSDLPQSSVAWLLQSGLIETLDGKPAKKAKEEPQPVAPKVESPKVEPKTEYKADAKDGDGDGKVQDGTPFERPEGTELSADEIAERKAK